MVTNLSDREKPRWLQWKRIIVKFWPSSYQVEGPTLEQGIIEFQTSFTFFKFVILFIFIFLIFLFKHGKKWLRNVVESAILDTICVFRDLRRC